MYPRSETSGVSVDVDGPRRTGASALWNVEDSFLGRWSFDRTASFALSQGLAFVLRDLPVYPVIIIVIIIRSDVVKDTMSAMVKLAKEIITSMAETMPLLVQGGAEGTEECVLVLHAEVCW